MTIDYAHAREMMVEQQVRPWEVLDARVLDVLGTLPREDFLPAEQRALAYADVPLPLGGGAFSLKPVVVGRALQALALDGSEDVLEIGTGNGYLTACLGQLARDVVSIERDGERAAAADAAIKAHGLNNVQVVNADAMAWDTPRRFKVICVTGAVEAIPQKFIRWLEPGGRMFIVRGRSPAMEAVLLHNDVNGPRIQSLFETDLPYLAGAAPAPTFEF
ncbi:protein-L-isoaspartate O-methyltransferase family protein [Aerolutibacter ruishenii]|uniref:Protein-L-isoaspartate O-methyltransferase n=1 Tax=Aerolutibacter ruishenii TaxID=686800 RepID=A0A562LRX1_9GAMM|nr:protein-L-isoaspartate O-methyltransferase [Lysobacter ruishenii]TWI10356.1 protein-L-isoaspartate(D-aspartate) O-methyltransferase [Lysobacter ruishenii]